MATLYKFLRAKGSVKAGEVVPLSESRAKTLLEEKVIEEYKQTTPAKKSSKEELRAEDLLDDEDTETSLKKKKN